MLIDTMFASDMYQVYEINDDWLIDNTWKTYLVYFYWRARLFVLKNVSSVGPYQALQRQLFNLNQDI